MTWFEFSQNNSGGSFNYDGIAGISHRVFIEAESADDANAHALYIGIYFDGCSEDKDCSCCGDRWYPVYDDDYSKVDKSEVPEKGSVFVGTRAWKWMKGYEFFVHPLEGDFYGAGV